MYLTQNGQSKSQLAYEIIRKKIVSLELEPGAVIDEAALRTDLALGRTPIREALQRLALEKLVTIIPRRGMFVAEIGLTDLQRIVELRQPLESLAAQLAAQRGSDAHWAEMEEILSHFPSEGKVSNVDWIEIDEKLHQIIYAASDNKFLIDSLTSLYTLSLRLWYYAIPDLVGMDQAVNEHVAIFEALKAGDEAGVSKLIEDHIYHFQESIKSAMLKA